MLQDEIVSTAAKKKTSRNIWFIARAGLETALTLSDICVILYSPFNVADLLQK